MIPDIKDVDVVVAWYNENLDWLLTTVWSDTRIADYVVLYCKGPNDPPPEIAKRCKRIIKLDNVGREGHTYLYHIVHNYTGGLAANTVFLQGRVDDHIGVDAVLSFINNTKAFHAHHIGWIGWNDVINPINHYGVWLEKIQQKKLRQSQKYPHTYSWLTDAWGIRFPPHFSGSLPVVWGANFAVSRDNIRRIPVDVYEKIMNILGDHADPEEGHYQERTWAIIFSTSS